MTGLINQVPGLITSAIPSLHLCSCHWHIDHPIVEEGTLLEELTFHTYRSFEDGSEVKSG